MSQFKGTHRRRATFVRTNENVRNVVLSSTLRGQKQQVRHATTVHISYPEIIFFILIITQSAKRHGSPSCSSRERQHEPARRPVRPSALAKNDVLTAAPCALFWSGRRRAAVRWWKKKRSRSRSHFVVVIFNINFSFAAKALVEKTSFNLQMTATDDDDDD